MQLVEPAIDRYLERCAAEDDPVLQEMERLAETREFPIVGPQVGRLLRVLACSIGARRVLELGSGFGYSACWFAGAVGRDGQVVLTEGSAERAREAQAFLERAGYAGRVRIEVGDALEIVRGLEPGFDIVFNDVDKQDYGRVPEEAARVLRPGGMLISDNMLWDGRVVEPPPHEPSTGGVLSMTRTLLSSDRFETVLLPVRDGVSVSWFRG